MGVWRGSRAFPRPQCHPQGALTPPTPPGPSPVVCHLPAMSPSCLPGAAASLPPRPDLGCAAGGYMEYAPRYHWANWPAVATMPPVMRTVDRGEAG